MWHQLLDFSHTVSISQATSLPFITDSSSGVKEGDQKLTLAQLIEKLSHSLVEAGLQCHLQLHLHKS